MTRHSAEYSGWFEMSWKLSCLASAAPARQLLLGPLAHTDVESLALTHDVGEGLHGLFERRLVVEPVRLVEVDVVGLQPRQRTVDRFEDVLA